MNAWWCITILLLVCGCQPQSAGGRAPLGQVQTASLVPDVPVTVTDLSTGGEVAGVTMKADGHQLSALLPGHYAFAVTTATSFAFFERDIRSSDLVSVALSSDCHPVRGRITHGFALPANVSMSRVSNSKGDTFLAPISGDGSFRACLPKGAYAARVDGESRSFPVPMVMPADEIELSAYPTSRIQQTPKGITIAGSDFLTFANSLHEQRIIGLGEANHGTSEFYTYREKLSLQLARDGKLRNILLEADAVGMMAIDDYVMGEEIDLAKSVVALRFWITDIFEFLNFLADIRAYNASASASHKIHVLGIDAQRLEPPAQFLLAHRAELAISEREAELLSRIAPNHGKAFVDLADDEQASLSSLLDRLSNPKGQADLEGCPIRASIAARSIRYQLGYLTSALTIGLRDQAMAELAAYIVNLSSSSQTAIWAHNGHIARQPDEADKSLGQYLAEKFGSEYYPIAFLSYRGAARAWDQPGKIGVIPHDLLPTPSYNMESVIMNATNFVKVAWIDFGNSSSSFRQWLAVPRYVREFGSAYDPSDVQKLRRFPDAMAAVVVVQSANPSTPTPTGIRMIKK